MTIYIEALPTQVNICTLNTGHTSLSTHKKNKKRRNKKNFQPKHKSKARLNYICNIHSFYCLTDTLVESAQDLCK